MLFGHISDSEMIKNAAGKMVEEQWHDLAIRYPFIELDAFVVMPNHVHGILFLIGTDCIDTSGPALEMRDNLDAVAEGQIQPVNDLEFGQVIGAFKSMTTVAYIRGVKEEGWEPFSRRLWHRNFYEHIIRNERALDALRGYIEDNPASWHQDKYFVDATGGWRP